MIGSGLALQIVIAILVMKVPFFNHLIGALSQFFQKLLGFSVEGGEFIFGVLPTDRSFGATFAFRVLPSIVFFSALTSLLYYLGILQKIVFATRLGNAEDHAALRSGKSGGGG